MQAWHDHSEVSPAKKDRDRAPPSVKLPRSEGAAVGAYMADKETVPKLCQLCPGAVATLHPSELQKRRGVLRFLGGAQEVHAKLHTEPRYVEALRAAKCVKVCLWLVGWTRITHLWHVKAMDRNCRESCMRGPGYDIHG